MGFLGVFWVGGLTNNVMKASPVFLSLHGAVIEGKTEDLRKNALQALLLAMRGIIIRYWHKCYATNANVKKPKAVEYPIRG